MLTYARLRSHGDLVTVTARYAGLFYFQIWRSLRRRPYRLSAMGVSHKRWPSVDVLVPTYQEPVHVSQ